jgi:hypothetical protein
MSQISFTIENLVIIIVFINKNLVYYVFQNTCHFNKKGQVVQYVLKKYELF